MISPLLHHSNDDRLAHVLAHEAGIRLLALRTQLGYADRQALRNAGDATSHIWLAEQLQQARPADAILSEEGIDDPIRLAASRVWIVDPLDGTREFGEGRDDWAVHVALWQDGTLVAGAVAHPAAGRTYSTLPAVVPTAPIPARIRLAVSRSRTPTFMRKVAAELDAELVPMGSAGIKAMSVVTGETHAYVHSGGQYEWDSAAPVAVARAAGLHTSRLDGSVLTYNNADPYLPDLIIARPEIKSALLAAIASTGAMTPSEKPTD